MRYEKQIVKYEGAVYAATLVIGVICLSEFSGVGKLHDEKLQAGNEVVRLIKAFELRFCTPYGEDINYDYTYSSDVQEWDDTIIW